MQQVQSVIWSSIWSVETTLSYLSRKAKWLTFCSSYRRHSLDFSPRNLIDYVTFLSSTANSGAPHAWNTVLAYLGFVGQLAQFATGANSNPVSHPHVVLFMKGVGRYLGKAVKKAEPCTLQHLRALSLASVADPVSVPLATAALIATIAFWGCLRLGIFLPKTDLGRALLVSDLKVSPSSITVAIRHSKTIQFEERVKLVDVPARVDLLACPLEAIRRWTLAWQLHSSPHSFARPSLKLTEGLSRSTFLKLIADIPLAHSLPPLSGHSFRRGYVLLALTSGVSIERLMLHGDWRSLEVALSYAEDLLIPNPLMEGNSPSPVATPPSLVAPRRF
jgi:hypothetical protein